MKSKRKFDTILILSFLIFILSFITFGIVRDSIIELTNEFSWTELLRVIKWISLYLILYRFFYLANIKIIVNKINILYNNDTIIALATPSGAGAIAVIRLSGSKAVQMVDASFKSISNKLGTSPPIRLLAFMDIELIAFFAIP